jgi:hypothetical protein
MLKSKYIFQASGLARCLHCSGHNPFHQSSEIIMHIKLRLVLLAGVALFLAGPAPASAAWVAKIPTSLSAPQLGQVILAKNGGDHGRGHDAGDDHGSRDRSDSHGRDDGPGHDANDDHGGRDRSGSHGHDDGPRHDAGDDHGTRLPRKHGDDDGIGHTQLQTDQDFLVLAKHGADDQPGDDRGGKRGRGKGHGKDDGPKHT